MRGFLYLLIGLLVVLVGGLWALQGLGYVGGGAMSGVTAWAVIGPIVAVVGLLLVAVGVRAMRGGSQTSKKPDAVSK